MTGDNRWKEHYYYYDYGYFFQSFRSPSCAHRMYFLRYPVGRDPHIPLIIPMLVVSDIPSIKVNICANETFKSSLGQWK